MKQRPLIICVDDELVILNSLHNQLKEGLGNNYEIEIAESGEEALEIVDDIGDPLLIISDQIMPKMNGDKLLELIKTRSPKTKTIMLTGQASKDDITNAINKADLYRFIEKPWNKQDLIMTLKEAINSFYQLEKIEKQQLELIELNESLEESVRLKTEEIRNSIKYSKRIQDGILPNITDAKTFYSDLFLFQKPLSIVSGDFFWYARIDHLFFTSVIDCTGHGVPGAFMSIVGNLALNQIIKEEKIFEPNIILEKLHQRVVSMLKQESSHLQDGMDMALICIDNKSQVLKFAGAKNRLVYIKNNELSELKGNYLSIGGQIDIERQFDQHQLQLEKGMMLYLFSDGYQDQFGGEKNKKFQLKTLKELLKYIHNEPKKSKNKPLKLLF